MIHAYREISALSLSVIPTTTNHEFNPALRRTSPRAIPSGATLYADQRITNLIGGRGGNGSDQHAKAARTHARAYSRGRATTRWLLWCGPRSAALRPGHSAFDVIRSGRQTVQAGAFADALSAVTAHKPASPCGDALLVLVMPTALPTK